MNKGIEAQNLSSVLNLFLFSLMSLLFVSLRADFSNERGERYHRAISFIREENYERAIEELQILISDYPRYKLAYQKLAEMFIFTDQIQEGKKYFRNLLKRNKNNVYAYFAIAQFYILDEDYKNAIDCLKTCIRIDPHFEDAYGRFGGLTWIYKLNGQLDKSEHFFKRMTRQDPGNPFAHYGLGETFLHKFQLDVAQKHLERAVEMQPGMFIAYYSLFYVHRFKAEYKKSLEYGKILLDKAKDTGNLQMLAIAVSKIGQVYFFLGDFRKALGYYNRSLQLTQQLGDKTQETNVLNDLGSIYAFLGMYEKGLEYLNRSLFLSRKLGMIKREILVLYNIGLVYKDTRKYNDALNFFNKSLNLANRSQHQILNRLIFTGIAETYTALRDFISARSFFNKALTISQEINDKIQEGYILRNLGSICHELEDDSLAISYFEKALHIGIDTQDAQIIWESHSGLGAGYSRLGKIEKALLHFTQAIAIFDSIRVDLDVQSLSSAFLEDKYEVYPSVIQLLATSNKPQTAYRFAEKYKAKLVLDILIKANYMLAGLLPDSIFIELNEVRLQLSDIHRTISQERMESQPDQNKLLVLDQKLTELELRRSSLLRWIKTNKNEYYHIAFSEPIDVDIIQNKILLPGQALMEFVVGPQKSSVFIIKKDTLIYREIELERQEFRKRIFDLCALFSLRTTSNLNVENYITNAELADFSIPPAHKLYNLLMKPFEELLSDVNELIIIPDDFLFYLPFEILVTDTSGAEHRYDFRNVKFLLEDLTISYVSSASVLNPELHISGDPVSDLLALGNPAFNSAGVITKQKNAESTHTVEIRNKIPFSGLPHSENEVKTIVDLFGSSGSRFFIREEASEKVLKQVAPDYRFIHLASHFILDDQFPLYSKFLLACGADSSEDGFLQTYEVFDLNLQADLIVLSACNTALGKLRKGEGLVGISRAFLYAGVPSLVVSLWSVEDETTAKIMEYFYNSLKSGMPKNKALQSAKVRYLKMAENDKRDPYYWAPFILLGNWQRITFEEEGKANYAIYIALIIVLIIIFTMYWRKLRNSVK